MKKQILSIATALEVQLSKAERAAAQSERHLAGRAVEPELITITAEVGQ